MSAKTELKRLDKQAVAMYAAATTLHELGHGDLGDQVQAVAAGLVDQANAARRRVEIA